MAETPYTVPAKASRSLDEWAQMYPGGRDEMLRAACDGAPDGFDPRKANQN